MPNRVEVKSVELCLVIPSGFALGSKDHTEKDSTPATGLGVILHWVVKIILNFFSLFIHKVSLFIQGVQIRNF